MIAPSLNTIASPRSHILHRIIHQSIKRGQEKSIHRIKENKGASIIECQGNRKSGMYVLYPSMSQGSILVTSFMDGKWIDKMKDYFHLSQIFILNSYSPSLSFVILAFFHFTTYISMTLFVLILFVRFAFSHFTTVIYLTRYAMCYIVWQTTSRKKSTSFLRSIFARIYI